MSLSIITNTSAQCVIIMSAVLQVNEVHRDDLHFRPLFDLREP
jgi:hypothetical protein